MKNAKHFVAAGLIATTVFLAGCAGGGMGGSAKVATVDGKVITKSDYDKTYNEFSKGFKMDTVPKEQRTMVEGMVKQMTLNKLILHTIIYGEAEKMGIKITDAEVAKHKQEKIFNNPKLKEEFKTFLTQNSMTEAEFNAMLKENLLLSKFMDAKGGDAVKVSDVEIKTVYNKNQKQFQLPERIHASHILVKAVVPELKKELREKNPKITDTELNQSVEARQQEMKAKAEDLFKQVKADPAKFEELAKKHSEDTVSARAGGDLGFMVENNTDAQFWAALEKTAPGKLYPNVVPTVFGYHIVRVLEKNPAHQESYAEAKEFIREHLSQNKKQEFLKQWAEQKRNEIEVVIEPAYMPKETDMGMGGAPMQGGAPAGVIPSEAPHQSQQAAQPATGKH